MVSPNSLANTDAQEWTKEMVKRLKATPELFTKKRYQRVFELKKSVKTVFYRQDYSLLQYNRILGYDTSLNWYC